MIFPSGERNGALRLRLAYVRDRGVLASSLRAGKDSDAHSGLFERSPASDVGSAGMRPPRSFKPLVEWSGLLQNIVMRLISDSVIVAVLWVISATSMSLAEQPAPSRQYRNPKYGVAVNLPARANVCRPIAASPNHGMLFRPAGVTTPPCDDDIESGTRYTAIDAHFAPDDEPADVRAMARKECPAFAYDSQGKVTMMPAPTLSGGLPRALCRIDGVDGSIIVTLLARRAASARVPAIDYTFTLKTTRSLYRTDYPVFARWLAGVRFFRPL